MTDVEISVVVPCFNEREGLPEFHRRVTAVCAGLGVSYELLLVNDGSTDDTWATMLALRRDDPRLVLVNLARNHGHQLALTAGLSLCNGRRVLIIDADLQDPPELLPKMLAVMDDGADVVYGRRLQRRGEAPFKRWTAAAFYRAIEALSDVPIPRDAGDFRLISRRALDVLRAMPERHRFLRGMVSWVGFRQEPVLYDRDPRFAGETKYPLRKMIRLAIDAITGFSIRPLTLAVTLGLGTASIGGLLLLYALASWAWGSTVVGWTSLIGAMALLSSVQLLVLGIIGEYLGRLYEQAKGRPLFIIESVLSARGGVEAPSVAAEKSGDLPGAAPTSQAGAGPFPQDPPPAAADQRH